LHRPSSRAFAAIVGVTQVGPFLAGTQTAGRSMDGLLMNDG
jgi:hypothetical protein